MHVHSVCVYMCVPCYSCRGPYLQSPSAESCVWLCPSRPHHTLHIQHVCSDEQLTKCMLCACVYGVSLSGQLVPGSERERELATPVTSLVINTMCSVMRNPSVFSLLWEIALDTLHTLSTVHTGSAIQWLPWVQACEKCAAIVLSILHLDVCRWELLNLSRLQVTLTLPAHMGNVGIQGRIQTQAASFQVHPFAHGEM